MTVATQKGTATELSPANVGRGKLVLVVDDHSDFRLAMQGLLEHLGFKVMSAGNGREALRILTRQSVALVVTDLYMPEMDGVELIDRLAGTQRPIPPIIAVTGEDHVASVSVSQVATALGAKGVLYKPFTAQQLVGAIALALREPEPLLT